MSERGFISKEKQDLLKNKYSSLFFRNGKQTMFRPFIECDDGWYNLIDDLCKKISNLCDNKEVVSVECIKEKFGGLRFYIGFYIGQIGSEELAKKVYDLIMDAENESLCICEICGSRDNVTTKAKKDSFYIRTLCYNCAT